MHEAAGRGEVRGWIWSEIVVRVLPVEDVGGLKPRPSDWIFVHVFFTGDRDGELGEELLLIIIGVIGAQGRRWGVGGGGRRVRVQVRGGRGGGGLAEKDQAAAGGGRWGCVLPQHSSARARGVVHSPRHLVGSGENAEIEIATLEFRPRLEEETGLIASGKLVTHFMPRDYLSQWLGKANGWERTLSNGMLGGFSLISRWSLMELA